MKKCAFFLQVVVFLLCTAACSMKVASSPAELTVFAAASLAETLQEIAEQYKTVAPDVTLIFNFDSSGTLVRQIKEEADCDLFISASPRQLEELDESIVTAQTALLENILLLRET